jgi:hypothetical protein
MARKGTHMRECQQPSVNHNGWAHIEVHTEYQGLNLGNLPERHARTWS